MFHREIKRANSNSWQIETTASGALPAIKRKFLKKWRYQLSDKIMFLY